LTWTRKVPDVPGWYWVKTKHIYNGHPIIGEVVAIQELKFLQRILEEST